MTRSESAVSEKFIVGDRIETSQKVNIRTTASLSGKLLGKQKTGAQGTITKGPVSSNGYIWWSVNYDTGADGWSAEDFLRNFVSNKESTDFDLKIEQLRNELTSRINQLVLQLQSQYAATSNAIALTNKIDQLTNTTITTPTITGGSIANTSISGSTISGGTISGTIAGATADQATISNTVTGLTSLTTPHDTDLLPIVDMSNTATTKNIQRQNLIRRFGSTRIVVSGTSGVNQTIASGSMDLVTFAGASVMAGSFVANTRYVIQTLGTTDFTAIGAGNNPAPGTTFRATGAGSGTGTAYVYVGGTVTGGVVVSAGSFVAGQQYAILTTGTTDFTAIGASSNTPGYMFTANGPGTGTGTAYANTDGAADLFNSRIVIPSWAHWISVVGHIGYNNQTNSSATTGAAFVHLWRNGLPTSEAYMHTNVPYIPNYGSVTSVLGISGWIPVQSTDEYWTLVAEQRTGQSATLAKFIAPENWLLVAYQE